MGFGPKPQDIVAGAQVGPQAVIADLLSRPLTTPADWHFPTGTDWVATDQWAMQMINNMAGGANPLQERMAWILHGLVVVALDGTVYFPELRDHVLRIRTNPLGSYKQILTDTATMPAMLKYLTGYQNTKQHPNQNYARELMELFTLGRVHPVTGAANYTEQDVREIARALTGWQYNWTTATTFFSPTYYDSGTKTFLGQPRGNAGLTQVMDAVTSHPSWPYYVPLRMYRELVGLDPDPATLSSLGSAWGANGDLLGLVTAITSLPDFLSDAAIGARVKCPMELIAFAARGLGIADVSTFGFGWQLRDYFGQHPFNAPNVSGWPTGPRWLHADHVMTWSGFASTMVASVRGVAGSPPQKLAQSSPATAADVGAQLLGLPDLLPGTRAAVQSYVSAGSWNVDRAAGVLHLLLLSPDFLTN